MILSREGGLDRTKDHAQSCPVCGRPAARGHACVRRPGSRPFGEPPGSLIGKNLGQNYRVIEPVGAGAMGMVYVVEHLALRKRFAAKVLTADLARHPEAIARFEVEAHAASRLDHENIVSVVDYGKTDDGCVFIIMELLRGKTLQARMDQGRLSLDEVVAVVIQVCRALAAAHAAGIVHRDMKPENVFLTERPGGRTVVKVLDFGISKAGENGLRDGRITKQGQLLGSPEYMSPEASRGEDVDARADIYAVGIMLYELLCGEVPFRHANYLKILQMHANMPPRPPRRLSPQLSEELDRLILRALEKSPSRRQASIEELEAELMAALPAAAARALLQMQAPSRRWMAEAATSVLSVAGTNPGLAEGTDISRAPSADSPPDPTLETRRRGHRAVLLAVWSAVTIGGASATTVAVLRWDEAQYAISSALDPAPAGAGPAEAAPVVAVSGPAAPAASGPAADPALAAPSAAPGLSIPGTPSEAAPSPAAETSADASPASPPAAPAGSIHLQVESSPAGGIVTLDGVRMGWTPLDTWIRAEARAGSLSIELRGYRTATLPLSLEQDGLLRVPLQRDSHRARRAVHAAEPPAAPATPDIPDIKEGR
jgi:serine/threonine-protein kinase